MLHQVLKGKMWHEPVLIVVSLRMSNTVGTASQQVVKTNKKRPQPVAHRFCFALFNKYNL